MNMNVTQYSLSKARFKMAHGDILNGLLLFIFGLLTGGLCHVIDSNDCRFNVSWRGTWYQSGLTDIVINETYMSRKGYCRAQQRDYFLIENTEDGCQQCLLILNPHPNILQYKESFCIPSESMDKLCQQIRERGEAVLYTLVREPSRSVICPFHNAYHVIYNNSSGGFCRDPSSYAHQCAAGSIFHFRFRRCQRNAYTSDKDLRLRCLAKWKDGSDMYVYGELSSEGVVSPEDKYRCFMYVIQGTVVYLAMSADATCRGLRSPRDGPLMMELTEDVHGWPAAGCSFPSTLLDKSWRDLIGTNIYSSLPSSHSSDGASDQTSNAAVGQQQISDGHSGWTSRHKAWAIGHVAESYKCLRNNSVSEHPGVMIYSHVMEGCQQRFVCLRIIPKHFRVVQIQKSTVIDSSTRHHCTTEDFRNPDYNEILVSTTLETASCPFAGVYRSFIDATNCQLSVVAGCSDKSRLDVMSSCQTRPVLQLKCMVWWNEGTTKHLIAHELTKDDSSRLFCYTMHQRERTFDISFGQSNRCSDNSVNENQTIETYSFQNYIEECPPELLPPEVDIVRPVDDSPISVGDNYSHVGDYVTGKHVISSRTDQRTSIITSSCGQSVCLFAACDNAHQLINAIVIGILGGLIAAGSTFPFLSMTT